MMEKDKLRKADIFSGSMIFLAGCAIVGQALKMPMKDSWGGVQNVWYVSPAIFPLFIGAMIMLLGGLLVRTAFRETGVGGLARVKAFVFSPELIRFLQRDENIRFYAIVTMLISFVYLYLPRVDFFLAAIQFLLVFITVFYLDDLGILKRMFVFYLGLTLIFTLLLITGLFAYFSSFADYPADILVLIFIPSLAVYAFVLVRNRDGMAKKMRTSLVIAVAAPLVIGVVFKYLLLVPMPFEGMVIELADLIWYAAF